MTEHNVDITDYNLSNIYSELQTYIIDERLVIDPILFMFMLYACKEFVLEKISDRTTYVGKLSNHINVYVDVNDNHGTVKHTIFKK